MYFTQTAAFEKGLSDFYYNYCFTPGGDIIEGRGWAMESGANGDSQYGDAYANDHYAAICYLAGPGEPFTDEARHAASILTYEWCSVFGDPNPVTVPHRYWHPTECPGNEFAFFYEHGLWRTPIDQPAPEPEDEVTRQLWYPNEPFKAGPFKGLTPTLAVEVGEGGLYADRLNAAQVKRAVAGKIPGPQGVPLDWFKNKILRDSSSL